MSKALDGKQALVCGASQGIGAATALALAEQGAEVLLLARNTEKLQQVLEQLSCEQGQTHRCLAFDLMDTPGLHQLAKQLPAVQIVVNNAGGPAPGPLLKAAPEQFEAAFRLHVLAPQVLAQALLPGMQAAGYGRIINIISTSVKAPISGLGVSNTIRAAVASWAKTLASELAAEQITVNNVLPGFTQTERLEAIIHNRASARQAEPEQIAAEMREQVPARRFAEAHEIAAAVTFLASPAAGYITGINLPVDGGRTPCL